MATAADIVTGILVTELTADDDLINNIMSNEKRLMIKRFFFNKQKRKRNLAYVTMNTLIRLSLKKKKLALMRKRKFKLNKAKNDSIDSNTSFVGESSIDHDYVDVSTSKLSTEFQQFKDHFYIERKTFDKIVNAVALKFGNQEKLSLSVERKVLIGLWILSTQESFRNIAEKFGIPKSSAYYAFVQLIGALNSLSSTFISWPQDAASTDVISGDFLQHFKFPDVLGVIGSTQIPVKISSSEENIESKIEPYSIVVLQAVCDHQMKFIDIHIGNPQPSQTTACSWKFFEGSSLGQKIANNEITFSSGLYMLGDENFPLKTYLLTPYKKDESSPLTDEKESFNTSHKSTRKVINKSFELLLEKFSRLKFVDTSRSELVPQIVTAACVLHNIILEDNLESDPELMLNVMGIKNEENEEEKEHSCSQTDHDIDQDAVTKRDSVAIKLKSPKTEN